ncbi:MAG: T9SS type A sorting domain-containing protein, partial [Ginsengibacter sp.]
DLSTIVSGPNYLVSPTYYKEKPGSYTITPYGLVLSNPNNYKVTYIDGTLTVYEEDEDEDNHHHHRNHREGAITELSVEPLIGLKPVYVSKDFLGIVPLTEGQKNVTYQNPNRGNMIARLSDEILARETQGNTTVYPNPTVGKVTLRVNNASLDQNGIIISDVLGRVYSNGIVKKVYSNSVQIDMTNLKSGVYFIRVKVENAIKIFRVIKL